MKKIITIIILVVVGLVIYNYFFEDKARKKKEREAYESSVSYKGRQLEAREMLLRAYQAMESFNAKNYHFPRKLDSLDIPLEGTYYELRLLDVDRDGYEIRAEGDIDDDGKIDSWVVDRDGRPYNIVNDLDQ